MSFFLIFYKKIKKVLQKEKETCYDTSCRHENMTLVSMSH